MPNDVNVNRFSVGFIDRDAEKTTTSVNIAEAVDNPTYETNRDAFLTAVGNVTNGTRYRYESSLPTLTSSIPPSNTSFRENKWLVRFEDQVNFKRGSFTVGTADAGTVTFIPGTDRVDLDDAGVGADLKTQIETFVVSDDGNAITVIDVEFVGRNI